MERSVTIVVVLYNSAAELPRLKESLVLGLEGVHDYEMVVVDNASIDGSAEIAKDLWPLAKVVSLSENVGYAAGINCGVAGGRPDSHLLILNPDVEMTRGAICQLVKGLAGPGVAIAVPKILEPDGSLAFSLRRDPTLTRAWAMALLGGALAGKLRVSELVTNPDAYVSPRNVDWATGAALLIGGEYRDVVGPWDESFFLYSEEVEYCQRARKLGLTIRFCPEAVVIHGRGASGRSEELVRLMTSNRNVLYARNHGVLAQCLFRAAARLANGRRRLMPQWVRSVAPRPVVEPAEVPPMGSVGSSIGPGTWRQRSSRVAVMSADGQIYAARERGFATRGWDRFAIECGASFRVSLREVEAHRFRYIRSERLLRFSVYTRDRSGGKGRRIGQCAVALSGAGGRFVDRLMLLPGHGVEWPQALQAVLDLLPPGEYLYGWELNFEPSRESEIASIRGVQVRDVRPITVHAVEFWRWDSWDAYYRAISENVRRNVRKSTRDLPSLRIQGRKGLRSVALLPKLLGLREVMYRRKGLTFDRRQAGLSAMLQTLLHGGRAFTALAMDGSRALAGFRGIIFGSNTYYLDGGSVAGEGGASWLLMTEMLRSAYARHPKGLFVMGYVDFDKYEEARGSGLLRQRQSCRATGSETSIVRFEWAPVAYSA